MKIDYKLLNLLALSIILVLFIQPISTSAQVEEIYYPEFKSTKSTFVANEHNDLFIKSRNYENDGTNSYTANTTTNQYRYTQNQRYFWDSDTAGTKFRNYHDGILEIEGTSGRTKVEIERNYYSLQKGFQEDLESGDRVDGVIENIAMFDNERYGFIMNVNWINPHFFEIMTDTVAGSSSFTMYVEVISPSGVSSTYSHGIVRDVKDFIPFVPMETGKHVVFMEPSRDVIISSLSLNEQPEVITNTRAFSEHIEGEEPVAKFFRIPPQGAPIGVNLHQLTTTYSWMGSIRIQYFGSDTNTVFGSYFSEANILTDETVYVVIIATPPNENDPYVKGAKDDLGLEEGMDIEYTILVRYQTLDPLPQNSTFNPEGQDFDDTYVYYQYKTSTTQFIGLNSSGGSNDYLYFIPMNVSNSWIYVDDDSSDVINDPNDNMIAIAPGEYVVRAFRSVDYFVQFIETNELAFTNRQSVMLEEGQKIFYLLPTDGYQLSRYNLTGTQNLNYSASFQVNIYDEMGTIREIDSYTINNYYNEFGNFVGSNFTEMTFAYEMGTSLLSLHLTNLNFYDENGTLLTDDLPSQYLAFNFERFDDIPILMERSNTVKYTSNTLTTSHTEMIHSNYSDYRAFLSIPTQQNFAYRVTIDATNRSISDVDLIAGVYDYFRSGLSQTTSEMVDNQTHYMLSFSFASHIAMEFGLRVDLGSEAVNGSVTISIEVIPLYQPPNLDLGEINDTELDFDGPFYTQPIFWFSLAGIVVVGSVGIKYGLPKRILSRLRRGD